MIFNATYLKGGNDISPCTYGVEWDGTATTKWARTDNAILFSDPNPAVNNGIGSSPFDNIMPWAGMKRVTDPVAGELVEIPKFWYKLTQNGTKLKIQIANIPLDGFHVSPAHMDRGDGKGERDVVYVGRYHCGSDYTSKTNVSPKRNITISTAINNIHSLGETIYSYDYAMNWTIKFLYLVEYADWNTQQTIGVGCGTSLSYNVGLTDGMIYHTGTSSLSKDNVGSTQYRWIEGLWDNGCDFCAGVYVTSKNYYIILNPNNYDDTASGTNGTFIGKRLSVYQTYVPTSFSVSETSGFEWCILPSSVTKATNTFACDNWVSQDYLLNLYAGGSYTTNEETLKTYGLFFFGVRPATDSNGVNDVGCRLQKLA